MDHDFDIAIDRAGSHSEKFDGCLQKFGRTDVNPLWIADMDFSAPPCVTDALSARLQHPIFGYTLYPDSLYDAIIDWFTRRHQWTIPREWIVLAPGVVPSLCAAVQAFAGIGEGVIVQPPIYPPFFSAVTANHRQLILNPLRESDGHYRMDLNHLESAARQGARLLMLCSPHNPVGCVWDQTQLRELLQIARRHQMTIISDDIHCDIVYPGAKHTMLARLAEPTDQIITAISPGKTFNIQGLGLSALIMPHAAQREAIAQAFGTLETGNSNPLSISAFEAAYRGGDSWLEALLAYLEATIDYVADYLHRYLPQIKLIRPQASYLLWLDCRELGMDDGALRDFMINQCKLGLNPGDIYGSGGSGFMRMNIGTTRKRVGEALASIRHALHPSP
ncbi:MAG: PatB family C-S lyase [Rhodanobacter sp.]